MLLWKTSEVEYLVERITGKTEFDGRSLCLKGTKPPQIISESQNNNIVQDLSSDSKDDDSRSVGSEWNNADGADDRTSSLIQSNAEEGRGDIVPNVAKDGAADDNARSRIEHEVVPDDSKDYGVADDNTSTLIQPEGGLSPRLKKELCVADVLATLLNPEVEPSTVISLNSGRSQVVFTCSYKTGNQAAPKNTLKKHYLVYDYMMVDVEEAIQSGHRDLLHCYDTIGISVRQQYMTQQKRITRVYYSMTPLVHTETNGMRYFLLRQLLTLCAKPVDHWFVLDLEKDKVEVWKDNKVMWSYHSDTEIPVSQKDYERYEALYDVFLDRQSYVYKKHHLRKRDSKSDPARRVQNMREGDTDPALTNWMRFYTQKENLPAPSMTDPLPPRKIALANRHALKVAEEEAKSSKKDAEEYARQLKKRNEKAAKAFDELNRRHQQALEDQKKEFEKEKVKLAKDKTAEKPAKSSGIISQVKKATAKVMALKPSSKPVKTPRSRSGREVIALDVESDESESDESESDDGSDNEGEEEVINSSHRSKQRRGTSSDDQQVFTSREVDFVRYAERIAVENEHFRSQHHEGKMSAFIKAKCSEQRGSGGKSTTQTKKKERKNERKKEKKQVKVKAKGNKKSEQAKVQKKSEQKKLMKAVKAEVKRLAEKVLVKKRKKELQKAAGGGGRQKESKKRKRVIENEDCSRVTKAKKKKNKKHKQK